MDLSDINLNKLNDLVNLMISFIKNGKSKKKSKVTNTNPMKKDCTIFVQFLSNAIQKTYDYCTITAVFWIKMAIQFF
jgi:hypothetical protein